MMHQTSNYVSFLGEPTKPWHSFSASTLASTPQGSPTVSQKEHLKDEQAKEIRILPDENLRKQAFRALCRCGLDGFTNQIVSQENSNVRFWNSCTFTPEQLNADQSLYLEPFTAVKIHSLPSAAGQDLNGQSGFILEADVNSGLYVVKLGDGFDLVNRCNLMV